MSKNPDNIFSNARSGGKSLTMGKIVRRSHIEKLRDGEPCDHVGCLSHLSHPCEGCGRIGGMRNKNLFIRDDIGEVWTFNGERVHLAGLNEEGSGYPCSSWEGAIEILNEKGYISSRERVEVGSLLSHAMTKAVELGILPELVHPDVYIKNYRAMKGLIEFIQRNQLL